MTLSAPNPGCKASDVFMMFREGQVQAILVPLLAGPFSTQWLFEGAK